MTASVLTLVSDHAGALRAGMARLRAFMPEPDIGSPCVLSENEALEWQIADPAVAARVDLARLLDDLPVDWALQPSTHRRKTILIADMDSTIISVECLDELADFAGKKTEISRITDRAMRGELDFEAALDARVAMLAGCPESLLEDCFAQRVRLNRGAAILVATMRSFGALTALASGGFTFFTERVAAMAGFERHYGNELEILAGQLTGRVIRPILGKAAKARILAELVDEREPGNPHGARLSLAIGDGANDAQMIAQAGLGLAYYAKPILAEQAHAQIRHGSLETALFFQGFARHEFATA